MPTTILSQSVSMQKLFAFVSELPFDQKQRLIARRIISSLKYDECRTLETVLDSDKHLTEKLIANATEKYKCLLRNDLSGIKHIIEDDAAILSL